MSSISQRKKTVAFIVPAHNEQTVIAGTINSIREIVDPSQIYVVSDGSTDNTVSEALKLTRNVLDLNPNVGKAQALNKVIEHFKLIENYSYIMPVDADCKIDPNFLDEALPLFENDPYQKIACVVGKVVGQNINWVTAYRVWEYEVAQSIHKAAQSHLKTIIVCPGPSTIYRSTIFKKVKIPTGTLTEDMDLTFMIHRLGLGLIKYCGKAKVLTQDPKTLKDFIRQNDRWHTGFWQCIKKHNMPWGGQSIDGEIALLAIEGLYNGILIIMFLALLPFILLTKPWLLGVPLVLDLLFFVVPTLSLTAYQRGDWSIFKYVFHFYIIRFASSFVFFKSFYKVVLGIDLNMGWNKIARYNFGYQTIHSQNIIFKSLRFIFHKVKILPSEERSIYG